MRNPLTLIIVVAVAIVAAVILVRAANSGPGVDMRDEAGAMGPDLTPDTAAALAPADMTFVTSAAESGNAEVELAQLAQRKSENSRVDALAERIERDHSQANDRLEDLADRRNVDFPNNVMGLPGPNEAQEATHDRLEELEGAAFDRAWASHMVESHQKGVDLYTTASQSADPDVRTFAESTLPVLKAHLQASQELQKQLGGPAR